MPNAALAEVRRMIRTLHTDRTECGPLADSDVERYAELCKAERHLIAALRSHGVPVLASE
jgi:hypothetical protein